MKLITQEDDFGCAVACVASVIGSTYGEARRYFKYPEHVRDRGYYRAPIVNALKNAGRRYDFQRCDGTFESSLLLVAEGSIAFIRGKNYPFGHYLLKTGEGYWMDSWINLPEIPRESGWRNHLSGEPTWIIYPKNRTTDRILSVNKKK